MISIELIQGCQAQDRKSQRVLYETLYPVFIRIAYRYAKNEEDAVEIVTKSYLKVIDNLGQMQQVAVLDAWLRKIAINTAIDFYRAQKRYQSIIKFTTSDTYNPLENLSVNYNTIEQDLEAEYIVTMVSQLPDVTREVLNLFAIDGYSHAEVSEMLSITQEMSRWHLHKARKLMTEKLEEFNTSKKKYK